MLSRRFTNDGKPAFSLNELQQGMNLMKRVVVTGGAGFIGYNLAKRLARDNHHQGNVKT